MMSRFTDIPLQPAVITLIVAVSSLLGCSPRTSLEDHLRHYNKRVAAVLDAQAPDFLPPPELVYPPLSTLRHDIPRTAINVRDYHALNTCAVVGLIGERNTALGKIQAPSRRFIYELRLIEGLELCLANQLNEQLASKISAWLAQKRATLPLVWADMIQLSKEIRHAFTDNRGYISDEQEDQLNAVWQSLTYLLSISGTPATSEAQLESNLLILQRYPGPARLYRTQQVLHLNLSQMNVWLEQQARSIPCQSASHGPNITYLHNVFSRHFIQHIQPLAGKLNYYHYKFRPLYLALLEKQELHAEFKSRIRAQLSSFDAYAQTMKEHISLWQSLLKPCGLQPV